MPKKSMELSDEAKAEIQNLYGSEGYHKLMVELTELHSAKNHDYSGGQNPFFNFLYAAAYSNTSLKNVFDTMIGIKEGRLIALRTVKAVNFESIADSEKDLIVYKMLSLACKLEMGEDYFIQPLTMEMILTDFEDVSF